MPKLNLDDTIVAVATPPGEGGIAVIRVSGPEAARLVSRFFRPSKKIDLERETSHTLHHGFLADEKGKTVDEVLVGLFRAPHSYTGEEVVEISCHGGLYLTRRILEILTEAGARHAEPGEFTKRAFLSGRLDLTQAEAVLDLIRAKSDASLEAARRQLEGGLSKKIQKLKNGLMKIYAHLEAGLDFPDERLEVDSRDELLRRMSGAEEEMEELVASFRKGLALREGILTVILGRPNVGKSSLLNSLLEKERALVSSLPGTTRDALEETVEIGGWNLRLADTAGLGASPKDEVDRMGMEKTKTYIEEGDFFLFLADGSSEWNSEDEKILQELKGKKFLLVVNKTDLPQKLDLDLLLKKIPGTPVFISCLTGAGISELEKKIAEKISGTEIVRESPTLTRLRHKQALKEALESLGRARKSLKDGTSTEFVLTDLKSALDRLRELVGEIYSEDLLDIIFQEFCIGK